MASLMGPSNAPSPAARRWVGVAVVVLVVLMHAAIELLAGHERPRVVVRLTFTALEMPLLMIVLSAMHERAKHRRYGSVLSLVTGILIAGCLGVGFSLVLWKLGAMYPELRPRSGPPPSPWRSAAFGFLFGQFRFGIWALAFVYPFAVEDARLRALEAERLATAADLARLRAHLEPHFILNTLNAIAGLVIEEPKEARRLLAALGDLLRDATQDLDELRPLEDEIVWLRRYAAILEARYGDAIVFRWDVDERAAHVLLPRLLLQPLVENAVKHGALRRSGGGRVAVLVRLEAGMLRCTIEDDGPGIDPSRPPRSGAIGLESVRRRLSLKDARATLVIDSSPSGTRATVSWPSEHEVASPRAA
jgi:signal transduction histidine kinase